MLFRDLPRRPRMAVPEWLPSKHDKKIYYKRSLVNGVPAPSSKQSEDAANDLKKSFDTRDDDVFVCTFVKSGTTWTQQMITLLLNKGVQGEKNYNETVPWLEALTFSEWLGEEAQNWTLPLLVSTPEKRFMKTHASLRELPAGSAKGLKVIYVARNPKDVCVSLYHHALNQPTPDFDGGFSDMMRFFAEGRCQNGSWFNHVLEWWEAAQADPEHVLFLHYEQMLSEPEEHVRKIADFAGIYHTPEIIAKTAAASSFSAMKKSAQSCKLNSTPAKRHVRKGGAGGWRDVMTVRESEAFDKIYREQMKGSGLKMDFGEGLVM